ncbi:hypothetical protein D6851_01735 [Altericroceibacterium spongiae]|uniref:Uracil-DNA glycosylase-like domain-containing protein n=1 Tax=Altericroceibacterium spongiae TaxID=2320269 RepID=A0A420ERC0_9SPHN|nr:hypothetical protein [Altericroceibacterium spongiae]RKF23227.1 hypothetical protein D6851_01735 [Altericroceibacterium spongiae]
MDHHPAPPLSDQFAALEEWWRLAGVSEDFSEQPASWLADTTEDRQAALAQAKKAQAAKLAAAKTRNETPSVGGNREKWPEKLADFQSWWLTESTLDEGGAYPRIAPRGSTGARLMIVVPEPEIDDKEKLLSGPHGRLIENFLLVAGLTPEETYFATALPRHTPLADWSGLGRAGMGDILRHHINLVVPERVLLLGRNILSLLGHDTTQHTARFAEITLQGVEMPTLAGMDPGMLLRHPRLQGHLWQCWLDWTEGKT